VRVVLQRVSRAEVRVAGRETQGIGKGFLLLVGLEQGDGRGELEWMARKIAGLRIFPDAAGQMNLGLGDVGGACLVVSQFTLLADCRKGRRPSFVRAMAPDAAEPMFEAFADMLRSAGLPVRTGVFGAHMDVELVNDGPVTLILERRPEPA